MKETRGDNLIYNAFLSVLVLRGLGPLNECILEGAMVTLFGSLGIWFQFETHLGIFFSNVINFRHNRETYSPVSESTSQLA